MTRSLLQLALSAAFLAALSMLVGCSSADKLARHLRRAEEHRLAMRYDSAEIEYFNVLKIDGANAVAIRQLGLIYQEQGRISRAVPFLQKAIEIAPEDFEVRIRFGIVQLAIGDHSGARQSAFAVLDLAPDNAEAILLLAEASARADDMHSARDRLVALPSASASAAVQTALGTLAFRDGDILTSRRLIESALRLDPDYVSALSAMGNLYAATGQQEQAGPFFSRAASLAPLRSTARLRLIQYKIQTGDVAAARAYLEETVAQAPDFIPAWTLLAEIALSARRLEDCKAIVARILGRDPFIPEALLLDARLKLEEKKPDEAIAALEQMQQLYPQAAQVPYALAAACLAKGDTEKAIAQLNQALRLAPGFDNAAIMLGNLQVQRGDPGAALATVRPLAVRRPDLVPAQLVLAEAFRGLGRFDEALAVYHRVDDAEPAGAQLPLLAGFTHLQAKNLPAARQAFDDALRREPDSLPAFEMLVNIDLAEKKSDEALKRIEVEQQRKPDRSALHVLRAKVLLASNQPDPAEAELLRAIDLDPEGRVPYMLLAQLYVGTGKREQAIQRLQEVVKTDSRDVRAWTMLGILHDQDRRYDEARRAYEATVAANPRHGVALNNLAYLLAERTNRLDEALDLAKRAREMLPGEPHTAGTLGWILFKKREYAWARSLLQESSAKQPESVLNAYHHGMVCYALGDENTARSAFEAALAKNEAFEGREDCQVRLAFLSLGDGSDRSAIDARLSVDPADPIALIRLGRLRARAGEAARAIEACRSILATHPDHEGALSLLGWTQIDGGAFADAVATARILYKLAPSSPDAVLLMARAAHLNGDHVWAASLLREAVRADTDNSVALHHLGEAELAIGALPEAVQAFRRGAGLATNPDDRTKAQQAIDLLDIAISPGEKVAELPRIRDYVAEHPDDLAGLVALAALEDVSGRAADAGALSERLLKRYPSHAPALARLAAIALAEGKLDRAQELAGKARERLRDDPRNTRTLGMLAFKRKEYRSALALLERVTTAYPDDPQFLFARGVSQHETGGGTAAAETLRRALAAGLTGAEAEEAQRLLPP